ncbi:MAG TPA: hypothetical protein DCP67_04210 [Planctomycetaceae bacterium]|nr:hypothetical protein [Planctomycetaceae bacterium]
MIPINKEGAIHCIDYGRLGHEICPLDAAWLMLFPELSEMRALRMFAEFGCRDSAPSQRRLQNPENNRLQMR